MHSAPPRTSTRSALGWGFYLACSWTWVIGMYLPVLLVRDYGWAGWLAFAIPNIIGAAAMGWMLRSPEQALRLVSEHASAVASFTVVTVSFQIFTLMWLLPRLVGIAGVLLVLAALLFAVVYPAAVGLGRPLNAVVVWAISAAVFVMLAVSGVLEMPEATGGAPPWHLVGLVPACLLGFALCPYLDATFLSARAHTDIRGARIAFGTGFGVLFLVMILFTLLYAIPLNQRPFAGGAAWLLAGHLTIQICFTIAAHTALSRVTPAGVMGVIIAAVLALAALGAELAEFQPFGLSAGEVIYRGYMGFYGLLFPAYVLLVMISKATMRKYWAVCAAALPFFAVGFLAGQMAWSAVGVGIVVAGAVATHLRRPRPAPEVVTG